MRNLRDDATAKAVEAVAMVADSAAEQILQLQAVIRAHHEWHILYDDVGGYPESDLCEMSMKAVPGLRNPSLAGGT